MRSASRSRRWLSPGASRTAAAACVAAALVATLSACSTAKPIPFVPAASVPVSPAVSSPPPTEKQSTLALLALIQIRTGPPASGYTAAQFGQSERAVPGGGGCKAHDFVMKRDLVDVTFTTGSTCVVNGGALFDRYTGTWLWYAKREAVHVVTFDYIVSLADAWASGASTWSSTQRAEFANDPEELLTTSTAAVAAKAGRTSDGWLPANPAERCSYVAQQIAIKSAYLLTVTEAERSAMIALINGCPDTFIVPKASTPPPPQPTPSPTKKPRPTKSPTPKPTTTKKP